MKSISCFVCLLCNLLRAQETHWCVQNEDWEHSLQSVLPHFLCHPALTILSFPLLSLPIHCLYHWLSSVEWGSMRWNGWHHWRGRPYWYRSGSCSAQMPWCTHHGHPLLARCQPAKVEWSTRATKNRPNQKLPDIILQHMLLLVFIAYSMTVEATMHKVRTRSREMYQ